jgi:hypothetical protein
MNVNDLSDMEAKTLMTKMTAAEILQAYTPEEISILVKKTAKLNLSAPPQMSMEISIPTSAPMTTNPVQVKYAGARQMVKNFGNAMIESGKTGFKMVTEEIFQQRLATCRACPHWQSEPVQRCKVCGCTTGKLKLASSRCPLNPPRWNRLV